MSSDVLGQGVVAPADEGQRPGREDEVDRRARTRPERDVALELGQAVRLGRPGGRRQPDGVLEQGRVDVDVVGGGLHREQAIGRQDLRDVGHRAGHPLDDDELLGRRRVADQHLEHEAVDLGLGQRVGALGLDRVLGGQDQERAGDLERLAPDRHLALLHDLEQRALDLGRRAVDLIGQQQVGEDRAEGRPELARLLVVDARADEVGRDEVRRELDPLELAADPVRERLDGHRLGQPGHALDEDVTARQQRDDQPLEQVVLTDDDLLDLVEQALHRGGPVLAG